MIDSKFLKAKKIVSSLGLTLTVHDEELRVNYKGGPEETAYYTNNLIDAVDTARDMAKRKDEKRASDSRGCDKDRQSDC